MNEPTISAADELLVKLREFAQTLDEEQRRLLAALLAPFVARVREPLSEALPAYDIGEELGRGAWGVVLEGEHRTLGRRVAIKQLPRAFAADPGVQARFASEAKLVASLDHPHIVPVYDYV